MQGPYYCYFVLLLPFVAPLGTNTTGALLLISLAFGYPREKTSTMSIHSYFAVKQHDEPELEKVVTSGMAEAVKTWKPHMQLSILNILPARVNSHFIHCLMDK